MTGLALPLGRRSRWRLTEAPRPDTAQQLYPLGRPRLHTSLRYRGIHAFLGQLVQYALRPVATVPVHAYESFCETRIVKQPVCQKLLQGLVDRRGGAELLQEFLSQFTGAVFAAGEQIEGCAPNDGAVGRRRGIRALSAQGHWRLRPKARGTQACSVASAAAPWLSALPRTSASSTAATSVFSRR